MAEYLSVREVAEIYNVNEMTVRRHIRKGQLRAVKIGGRVRIRKEDLVRFEKPMAATKGRLVIPPATKEQIERRKALAARADALRSRMKPLGMSSADLIRIAREEEEEKYERT